MDPDGLEMTKNYIQVHHNNGEVEDNLETLDLIVECQHKEEEDLFRLVSEAEEEEEVLVTNHLNIVETKNTIVNREEDMDPIKTTDMRLHLLLLEEEASAEEAEKVLTLVVVVLVEAEDIEHLL